jgi:hypothetical protein
LIVGQRDLAERAVGTGYPRHPTAHIADVQPGSVVEHEDVAGQRARGDGLDTVVALQMLLEVNRQLRRPIQSADTQTRPTAHAGGEDDYARRVRVTRSRHDRNRSGLSCLVAWPGSMA